MVAWVDNGTPIAALLWSLIEPAGKALGVNMVRYSVGSSAATVSSGFDSVLAAKPKAVIVGGINPQLWHNQLRPCRPTRFPVVTTGSSALHPTESRIRRPRKPPPSSKAS